SGNHGTPNQDNAPHMTAPYYERYEYDPAGNLVALKHTQAGQTPWVRRFGMGGFSPAEWAAAWPSHVTPEAPWLNPPANGYTHVGDDDPAAPQTHLFDANGNLIRETTSRHFEWDHANRLRAFRTQTEAAEPSVYTHYLYDGDGRRVKKLV